MENENYRKAFIANHSRLVRKLTSSELIETTFSHSLLTVSEKELVQAEKTESLRVDKLLSIFHRRYYSDPTIFVTLFKILEEVNEDENGIIEHVLLALKESLTNPPTFPNFRGVMSESDRLRLKQNEMSILSLDVMQILADLISEGVISFEESEKVKNGLDFFDKAKKLFDLLLGRGSDVFHRFVTVLKESEVYEQLANRLSGEMDGRSEIDDKKYVEKVLKDGHVPPLPPKNIQRVEFLKLIRKELRKLKDRDSWVVIYGLPGFGKTMLAAESVSQASILRDVFPGGVFWLNIGKMADGTGAVDKAALLEKVQNFIVRMDINRHRPLNLESTTDYLQSVMTEQHPQSLLILDDVWEQETAQIFSVRCRTLVTTRNAEVAAGVATNCVYKVSVTQGLTDLEGKELLSKCTGLPVSSLPYEASEIIKLCYGSPIVLNIIGSGLQKVSTTPRWRKTLERLKTQHAGIIVVRTHSPDFNRRRSSEQQRGRIKETLNTSIALSEESLPPDITDYFHWLVVFEEDTVIETAALATMWNTDEFTAEETMSSLVSWSLAQQAHTQSNKDGFLSFRIHDMVLDYLRDTVNDDEQRSYHQQLIERYDKKCKGDFASLEPDGYIHQKLLSHLHSAGRYDVLGSLLSNLRWLVASVQHWDSNSLLGAYKKYRDDLPDNLVATVMEFQLFISGHLNVLSTGPSLADVVQLALNVPNSQELLDQAKEEAKKDNKSIWLTWSNQSTIDRPDAILQLQPHECEVKHCQYFDQGSKVMSCSSNIVKIWVASTGQELHSFGGHDDQITHCVISEGGEILVTCSEDTTCKVWEVARKKLLFTFAEHYDGIQACDLSPDSKTVVSADINSQVIVWSSQTGEVLEQWNYGETGVTSCVFVPKGDAVIVANQEGMMKLLSLKGECKATFLLPTLSHSQTGGFDFSNSRGPSRTLSTGSNQGFSVRSCVVSRDGKLLAAAVGDCSAKVWSLENAEFQQAFLHSSDVLSVDFSPDAKLLVTGCLSGTVKVWSLPQKGLILDLPLHYDWVMCVKFSPSGSHILSSSYPVGIIKIIEVETNQQKWKMYRRRFSVHFIMNLERSGYIPTIMCYNMREQKLEICEGLQATPTRTLETKKDRKPHSWYLSPDGRQVVVGYDEGMLQLLDVSTGHEEWVINEAHKDKILHCYFSPNGERIVSCGDSDGKHKVWSVKHGKLLSCQQDCKDFWVQPCVFYQDSIRLASTKPGQVMVWNTSTGEELFCCEGLSEDPNESVLCVNISGDNNRIVASAVNGRVVVWNAETGVKIFTGTYISLSGDSLARYCSLNWDGSLVAVGHDDCTLKIYNVLTSDEITCHNNSSAWMISTQFSPDNKTIVTLSNSIQWWTTDGKLVKRFRLKSTFGKYIYFSPDFKTFITIDNTGLLYVLTVLNL